MNMSCRHRGWVAHHHRVRTESTEERPRQVWLLALGTLLPNCGAISETAGSWTELLEQSNMNSYELKIHVSQDSRNCSKTENIQSRNCNKTENIQKHPKNPKNAIPQFRNIARKSHHFPAPECCRQEAGVLSLGHGWEITRVCVQNFSPLSNAALWTYGILKILGTS